MIPPNFAAIMEQTETGREHFFRLVFGSAGSLKEEGYLCLAFIHQNTREMYQEFFKYPSELPKALAVIKRQSQLPTHAYFCPQLFKTRRRNKESVLTCPTAWADLDTCDPALLGVRPTVITQTSPGRYQALWAFARPVAPEVAEDISRKIAYFHAENGVDRSGWDLTQLLRIPYTVNYKYGDKNSAPIVTIVEANSRAFRQSDFNLYPEIPALAFAKEATPDFDAEDPISIIQRYRSTINPIAFGLFSETPTDDEDWSNRAWKLLQLLIEAGLSRSQTFTVMNDAACNKFARDGRPKNDLWREVLRGYIKHTEIRHKLPSQLQPVEDILSKGEIELVQGRETFIERYISWCKELTDAAPQYHQAGAFMALSGTLSANIILRTSFGKLLGNLWFMILGDTTLTRKTTSMRIAMNLLGDVDPSIMFATDGSMEGILTGIKARDGKSCIFFRDEFAGLLTAMNNKDYMSDMPEHLTKLYDGDPMRRLLRKEEISVYNPVFLIMAGGIKSKIQTLFTEEHISSGFIPRFIFITAEADLTRTRPVGPPKDDNDSFREIIKNELLDIDNHYSNPPMGERKSFNFGTQPHFPVELTPEAWERYNQFEFVMTKSAIETGLSYLTPMYDRLCKSTLKAAMLIAASRQRSLKVVVTLQDLLHAMYYARFWRDYANEVVHSIGKSPEERLIDKIMVQIKNTPGGVSKGELMQIHRLSSKQANGLFQTMIDRELIYSTVMSGTQRFHPTISGR